MALFGLSKDKKGEASSEQVLAYLEEAQRRRTPFLLLDAKERETTAHLVGLDEAGGTATFQYQGTLAAEKGARITPVFILDGLRIGNPCKCLALRPGQVELSLPEDLLILERRKHPRVRLNPKEGATLTALTGLFEGIGMTGVIENLSVGGARVRVERAMEAKGEKKLTPHAHLIAPGTCLRPREDQQTAEDPRQVRMPRQGRLPGWRRVWPGDRRFVRGFPGRGDGRPPEPGLEPGRAGPSNAAAQDAPGAGARSGGGEKSKGRRERAPHSGARAGRRAATDAPSPTRPASACH